MKKRNVSRNLLDMVPSRKEKIVWAEQEDGNIVLELEHRGFYAAIANIVFIVRV